MSFEMSLDELLSDYKDMMAESEGVLGARVVHLAPPGTVITKDRLGGVKKIEVASTPEFIKAGSFVLSPTEEMMKRVGLQERVDAVMTISASKLPETFDKVNSRFLADTGFRRNQEFKIKDIATVGQVGNEYCIMVIGLVVM